ncbi:unnamed protein product [Peronospora farinosa]|uniref:VHS domain-containing protein n=1 Tax=Peronospora farinosa TaxID=134698 RepID=A0AAV0SWX9_9STRA|nr:unnamed protein product [Peronospora farinosa]CAI5708005.1 unnamed protein product [Peronospora farinosa]
MSSQRNASTGIHALNAVNEAACFDDVLSKYFRISNAAGKRQRNHGTRYISAKDAEVSPATYLKQLKRLLRDAATQSQYIPKLYAMILYQSKRAIKSPIILSRVLDLCREIFKRSAVFRALIVTQSAAFFDQLLIAAGENPSVNVSRALRGRNRALKQVKMVLMLIETWKQDFGERYPSLVAGYAVLVDRGYEFPNEQERLQQERKQEVNARQNRQRVISVKKLQRDREMKQYVVEMEHVLVEMNRAFEILVPTMDTFLVSDDQEESELTLSAADENANAVSKKEHSETLRNDAYGDIDGSEKHDEDDTSTIEWEKVAIPSAARANEEEEDIEWENVPTDSGDTRDSSLSYSCDVDDVDSDQMDINDIVQAYGLGSSSYHLTVEVSKQVCEESSENDALFRSLADGTLRMRKRFLPLLDDWEQHSTTDPAASSLLTAPSQREVLQQIRDLRDRITRVLLKWEDLAHGSKVSKQYASTRSAVVSLPLDAYNRPTKHRRHGN